MDPDMRQEAKKQSNAGSAWQSARTRKQADHYRPILLRLMRDVQEAKKRREQLDRAAERFVPVWNWAA